MLHYAKDGGVVDAKTPTIPQSKINDFCQPPLRKEAFGLQTYIKAIREVPKLKMAKVAIGAQTVSAFW